MFFGAENTFYSCYLCFRQVTQPILIELIDDVTSEICIREVGLIEQQIAIGIHLGGRAVEIVINQNTSGRQFITFGVEQSAADGAAPAHFALIQFGLLQLAFAVMGRGGGGGIAGTVMAVRQSAAFGLGTVYHRGYVFGTALAVGLGGAVLAPGAAHHRGYVLGAALAVGLGSAVLAPGAAHQGRNVLGAALIVGLGGAVLAPGVAHHGRNVLGAALIVGLGSAVLAPGAAHHGRNIHGAALVVGLCGAVLTTGAGFHNIWVFFPFRKHAGREQAEH